MTAIERELALATAEVQHLIALVMLQKSTGWRAKNPGKWNGGQMSIDRASVLETRKKVQALRRTKPDHRDLAEEIGKLLSTTENTKGTERGKGL